MADLVSQAKELLDSGAVQVIIGYAAGTNGTRRPHLARNAAQAAHLVFDEGCVQNLAGYLVKPEVKRLGKAAILARTATARAALQLMAERQIADGSVRILAEAGDSVVVLDSAEALEAHLALQAEGISAKDRELLERLRAMTHAERWAFWQKELARCVKCYACRNSCPMCYCERCTMDCNRPQWVPVPSHAVGNLEYHTVRAMHLAGRCVECGECGRACPVGIPVHLMTFHAEDSVRRQFGSEAGRTAKLDYALSTFKPDDKETFIR